MDRRDEQDDVEREERGSGVMGENDPFWVARGRRHYEVPFQSRLTPYDEDTFLAARGRRSAKPGLRELISGEEPFWAARGMTYNHR